jgi:Ca2+-binding RTX toxin-like protein
LDFETGTKLATSDFDNDGFLSVQVTGGGGANNLDASAVTNLSVTLEGAGDIGTILGGQGNDELSGGVSNDSLTGSGSSDRFKYLATNDGVDTITDYNLTEDIIAISAAGFWWFNRRNSRCHSVCFR